MTRKIYTRLPGNIRTGSSDKIKCPNCKKRVYYTVKRRLMSAGYIVRCDECGNTILTSKE